MIIDPDGDGNWMDNNFLMDIKSDKRGVTASPGSYKVTVRDTDVAPVASFSKSSVRLTEGSELSAGNEVSISVAVPMGTKAANTPAGIGSLTNELRFTASPEGAAVATCPTADAPDEKAVVAVTLGGQLELLTSGDNEGQYETERRAGTMRFTACGDMSGFTTRWSRSASSRRR